MIEDLYQLPGDNTPTFKTFVVQSAAVAGALILLAAWISTQRIAAALQYPAQLGKPWWPWQASAALPCLYVTVSCVALAVLTLPFRRARRAAPILLAVALGAYACARGPLYSPLHCFVWYAHWHTYPGSAVLFAGTMRAWAIAAGVVLGAWLLMLPFASRRYAHQPDTHGSARWADREDLRKSGLLAKAEPGPIVDAPGLFLGLWSDGGAPVPLYDTEPHHVFCFAPTRSGKGVGLVIPNLLNWRGSVIVHDIKAENWMRTAGWRQRAGSLCVRFDPTYEHQGGGARLCARYNPLLEIRNHPHDVRDAQNIADMLVDPNGDRLRDHWDRTAHALLTGLILYAHHVYGGEPERCTLRQCAALLSQAASHANAAPDSRERPRNTVLEALRDADHLGDRPHPIIVEIMNAMIAKAPNEQSSVISTALSFLDLYRETLVADNTSASDFRIEDLLRKERPVSLYITVPPSDLSRTRALVRLMLNQICRRLTEELDHTEHTVKKPKRELLLMLDEFPALGKLPFFQDSLAYLAGYGIRAFLITQDLSQHQGIYGRDESITANCHTRIAFTPNKTETAELLSRMAGEMTVHQEKATRQAGGLGGALASRVSYSHAESRRRLLTPDETMRLDATTTLIFSGACRPILGRKARYYEDPLLLWRSNLPAPTASDVTARVAPPTQVFTQDPNEQGTAVPSPEPSSLAAPAPLEQAVGHRIDVAPKQRDLFDDLETRR